MMPAPRLSFLIALAAIGVVGCDGLRPYSEQIRTCEYVLKAKLKAPSSYKRIAVRSSTDATTPVHYLVVEIEYDAANSYNAMLRDTEVCYFKLTDGKAEPYPSLPPEQPSAEDDVSAAVDRALDAAADTAEALKEPEAVPEGRKPDRVPTDASDDAEAAAQAASDAVDNAIAAADAATQDD